MGDYAIAADVANLWRPLTSAEAARAEYLIGAASRRVRRRFPDVDARIVAGTLSWEDVQDVVASLVILALGGAPVPGARSWSVASGAESRSVTLGSGGGSRGNPLEFVFEQWMLDILAGESVATPTYHHMPESRNLAAIVGAPEVYPS